jgi:hypothetical protein
MSFAPSRSISESAALVNVPTFVVSALLPEAIFTDD